MVFDIDDLMDEDPADMGANEPSTPRPRTPALVDEYDPLFSPSFDPSPLARRRASTAPRDMSPDIRSQDPTPSIDHTQSIEVAMSNSPIQENEDTPDDTPGDARERSYSGSHHSRDITQHETQIEDLIERPARTVEEDMSYDDENNNDASRPQNNFQSPLYSPSPQIKVLGPLQSIFGGGPMKGNAVSRQQNNNKNLSQSRASASRKAPVVIDDGSDDDVIMIEPETASQEARRKWSAEKKGTARGKDVVIKKEKNDNLVVPDSQEDSQFSSTLPPTQPYQQSSRQSPTASFQSSSHNSEPRQSAQGLELTPNASQAREFQASVANQPDRPPLQKKQDIAAIIAAQQAMINKAQNCRNGPPGLRLPIGPAGYAPLASSCNAESSSAAAARNSADFVSKLTLPRIPRIVSPSPEVSQEGPSRMDAAMRQPKEDHSWMHEDDEIVESDYHRWTTVRDLLSSKEEDNTITAEEKLILFKMKRNIEHKDRLNAAAKRAASPEPEVEEDEESLFLPDRSDPSWHIRPYPARGLADDDDDGESSAENSNAGLHRMLQEEFGGGPKIPEDLGLTKSGKPRKRRMKRAANAREYEDQRREKERSKARKKKGRESGPAAKPTGKPRGRPPKGSPKEPAKGKGRGKVKAKGKEKEAKGKKRGPIKNGQSLLNTGFYSDFRNFNRGNDHVGQMILDDLVANDPIADRLHPVFANLVPEPEIHGRKNKETQFQTLFANIPPNEYATSSSSTDKKKLREASKSFGYAKCKAQDGKWLIKGMTSTLYHHQLLGAQWMVQRELSSQPPHGGLLADSMGLGKTVQTLACMVGNPPGPADISRSVKTTLIVVPAAVLSQWIDEINLHCEKKTFPKILHYKSSQNMSRAVLEDLDIVVTTYHEVMREFPFPDKEGREEIASIGYQRWWRKAVQNLGTLHQISWFRVVLDEAQAIKNNNARTSLACQNLKSVYRWCLTGTPLLNRLEELFPYLRFLKANYSMDWQTFQKYFCDPNTDECYSRISTLLSYTMMRRTMKTTILNRPIITLPPPHPEIMQINFSPEETIIYRITENRFRSNLNTYFAKGEARRNYGIFMVQLLRLRQCTSHPFMLERTIRESWTLEDVVELRTRLAKLSNNPTPFYSQCQVWVDKIVQDRDNAPKDEDASDEYTETADEIMPFGQAEYGHSFSIDKALKSVSEKDLFDRVVCGICSDLPSEPVKADCGHMFCHECLTNYMNHRLQVGDGVDFIVCPTCDRIINKVEKVQKSKLPHTVHNPFFDDEDDDGSGSNSGSRSGRGSKEKRIHPNSKGRDDLGFEPWTAETWLTQSDLNANFPLTPSAKTTALKAVLLNGFKAAPVDKVVVYVQFRTLARIVGRICRSEGWGFLYLTGDSSLEHRTKAIKKFRDDDEVKILIAGLKCGGLGLNFPWANRCISLDLWWNHAVEQQAFGRIFRIGQTKDTYMTRIVIKNSVDQRMLTMQLHKLQSLERAIRDGPDPAKPTLTLQQLANLFGFLRTDKDGEIVSIEPDYVDENGNHEGDRDRDVGMDIGDARSSFGAYSGSGRSAGARSGPMGGNVGRNGAGARGKSAGRGRARGSKGGRSGRDEDEDGDRDIDVDVDVDVDGEGEGKGEEDGVEDRAEDDMLRAYGGFGGFYGGEFSGDGVVLED